MRKAALMAYIFNRLDVADFPLQRGITAEVLQLLADTPEPEDAVWQTVARSVVLRRVSPLRHLDLFVDGPSPARVLTFDPPSSGGPSLVIAA